ncbi:MAG: TetR/AcrR family transcriptional regulator [Desulfobacteraceae bacterium]|nr:TetR/AcrR family transcriptional regulator [Desulfobacteraceae bacterium]
MKKTEPKARYREKQKAQTRALILETARNMFDELGYEKTTLRKVAAKAGISHGAILKHFENKSDILACALYDVIKKQGEKAFDSVPENATVQEQFLYIAEQLFRYYSLNPGLSSTLIKHNLFITGEWATKFDEQTGRFMDKLTDLIEQAKKRKEIKKNADSELITMSFFSHYIFVLIICLKETDFDHGIKMLEKLFEQTISGSRL